MTPGDAGTGGVLIDVCSFPSEQPNSDPSDCIVTRQCSKNNPNDPACDDQNPCTVDTCDPTFGVCHHVAGNQGALCRTPAGVCDVAEYCDGTNIHCPADQFAQSGVCRNASDVCDQAESCTGGLILHRLTNIPGSSAYVLGGFVTYSNDTKVKFLGVRQETLDRYGAVSEQTAAEMAREPGVAGAVEEIRKMLPV